MARFASLQCQRGSAFWKEKTPEIDARRRSGTARGRLELTPCNGRVALRDVDGSQRTAPTESAWHAAGQPGGSPLATAHPSHRKAVRREKWKTACNGEPAPSPERHRQLPPVCRTDESGKPSVKAEGKPAALRHARTGGANGRATGPGRQEVQIGLSGFPNEACLLHPTAGARKVPFCAFERLLPSFSP